MMWGFGDAPGWWMVMGGIWMFVFWAAVIGLIAWGIRSFTRRDERETPVEILQKRLARGEITPEQYQQLKAQLT